MKKYGLKISWVMNGSSLYTENETSMHHWKSYQHGGTAFAEAPDEQNVHCLLVLCFQFNGTRKVSQGLRQYKLEC